jgi:S-adenosylmethionine synthetase
MPTQKITVRVTASTSAPEYVAIDQVAKRLCETFEDVKMSFAIGDARYPLSVTLEPDGSPVVRADEFNEMTDSAVRYFRRYVAENLVPAS